MAISLVYFEDSQAPNRNQKCFLVSHSGVGDLEIALDPFVDERTFKNLKFQSFIVSDVTDSNFIGGFIYGYPVNIVDFSKSGSIFPKSEVQSGLPVYLIYRPDGVPPNSFGIETAMVAAPNKDDAIGVALSLSKMLPKNIFDGYKIMEIAASSSSEFRPSLFDGDHAHMRQHGKANGPLETVPNISNVVSNFVKKDKFNISKTTSEAQGDVSVLTITNPELPVYDSNIFGTEGLPNILFSGDLTAVSASGNVDLQYRVLNFNTDEVITNWTDFSVPNGPSWQVSFSLSASMTPLKTEVRSKLNITIKAAQSIQFFIGHIVGWLGQSLLARPLTHQVTGAFNPTSDKLYVLFNDQNGDLSSGPLNTTGVSSLGLQRMSAIIDQYFQAPVLIVDMTESGTGRSSMFDDSNTDRDWDITIENPVQYIQTRGSDLCVILDHWFTNDASTASNFDRQWAPGYLKRELGGLSAVDDNTGANDYINGEVLVYGGNMAYTPNHFLWDLTPGSSGIFHQNRTKWFPMYGASHWNSAAHTDGQIFTSDLQKGGIRKALEDLAGNSVFNPITLSSVAGYIGPESFGGHMAQPMDSHVQSLDVDGEPLVGVYQMLALGRAFGYLPREEPRVISSTFQSEGLFVDVKFSLGEGKLSTAFIENEIGSYDGSFEGLNWVSPSLDPTTLSQLKHVQGFSLYQNGAFSFTNFTADIQDSILGIVRITPTSPFVNGDIVNFGYGDGVHLLNASDVLASRPHTRWPLETRDHVTGSGYGYPAVRESGSASLLVASGITEVEETSFTTSLTNPTYFIDPVNVPSGVSNIRYVVRLKLPSLPTNGKHFFSQESGGADLRSLSNLKLRVYAEDSSGLNVINGSAGETGITPSVGIMQTYDLDIDHTEQKATFSLAGGTPIILPFAVNSNGFFQSSREVGFLANSGGNNALPFGVEVEFLEVYFNGTLHKRISGSTTEINADPWKRGGDVT